MGMSAQSPSPKATESKPNNKSVQITAHPTASTVQLHTRRQAIQYTLAALATAGLLPVKPSQAGTSATGRTIVNGILSGYGLPTLKDVSGFTPILEQYGKLVVQFQYQKLKKGQPAGRIVMRMVAEQWILGQIRIQKGSSFHDLRKI